MQIDFFWDPGSTNTYFAWHLLKPIAKRYNAEVVLQPFNLGYVFRHHNYVLMEEPLAKIRNRKRDLDRWARKYKLPFRMPGEFPIKTSRILRGALAMRRWSLETEFIDAVFKSYWEQDDASVATDEGLEKIASTLDINSGEFLVLLSSDEIGELLRQKTGEALDRGVFGAPSFIIENELYWGKDRMEFIEDHLSRLA